MNVISAESNIHDDGLNDAFLVPDVGRYWMVYEFMTDGVAKNAWETVQKRTKYLSAWRTRQPRVPPHKHFTVIIIGEDHGQMAHAERICRMFSGKPWEPEEGLIDTLRHRRVDQAAESVASGTIGHKHVNRSREGWVFDKMGRPHPNP